MNKFRKILKLFFSAGTIATVISATATTMISCGKNHHYSWSDFKKLALNESAKNIATKASVSATEWKGLKSDDFEFKNESHPIAIDGVEHVVATIYSKTKDDTGLFTAIYKVNQKYEISDWKCTTQPSRFDPDWIKFIKAEAPTTPQEIVDNANPSANGWKNLSDFNFVKNTFVVNNINETISVKIHSDSENQDATFKIIYIRGLSYKVINWKCIIQPPGKGITFDEFQTEAVQADASQIVLNAAKKAKGWNSSQTNDFSFVIAPRITVPGSTISTTIKSASHSNTAVFTINYIGTKYNIKHWICASQPTVPYSWDNYAEDAIKGTNQPAKIYDILKTIYVNNSTSLPEVIIKQIKNRYNRIFRESLKVSQVKNKEPSMTFSLSATIDGATKYNITYLSATQNMNEHYKKTDFYVQSNKSGYQKWYESAVSVLKKQTNTLANHSLAIRILQLSGYNFTNLYKIAKEENGENKYYGKSINFSPYHQGIRQFSFSVSLALIENDKVVIKGISVVINYRASMKTQFDVSQIYSYLLVVSDGTLTT